MSLDIAFRDTGTGFIEAGLNNPLPTRGLPTSQKDIKYIQQVYSAGTLAPHTNTQRQLYTVPTGKVALVTSAWARIKRDGVATTPGWARAELGWFRNGVAQIYQTDGTTLATAGVTAAFVELMENDSNVVGFFREKNFPTPLWLPAGCQVFWNTFDLSTGGTLYFIMQSLILEFTP